MTPTITPKPPRRYRKRPAQTAPAATPVHVVGVMDEGDGYYLWTFTCPGEALIVALAEGVTSVPQLLLSGSVVPVSVAALGNNQLRALYEESGWTTWSVNEPPAGLVMNVVPAWVVPAGGEVELP